MMVGIRLFPLGCRQGCEGVLIPFPHPRVISIRIPAVRSCPCRILVSLSPESPNRFSVARPAILAVKTPQSRGMLRYVGRYVLRAKSSH
jgi:hypothetical protein